MPERVAQLDQARMDVNTLAQDPDAQQDASQELRNARASLQQAEDAYTDRNEEKTIHYSTLASQQAQTGQARIAEARSKAQVAKGEAERNRVLLEARTQEAQQANAAAEAAQRQLEDMQAKQTDRGMVLTLGDVLFDTSSATLKPGAMTVVDRVATYLQQNPGTKVLIEGHTDSRGSEEYNMQLSERRALAVGDALASRGVDRGRVQSMGKGKAYPVASNETAVGQQQNRRVEIVFSDASGRFAGTADTSLR